MILTKHVEILAHHDHNDPSSIRESVWRHARDLKLGEGARWYVREEWNPHQAPVDKRRTIGVPNEYVIEELSQPVREAWIHCLSRLENRGHRVVPISLPHTKVALSAYYVLALAEASSNMAKYDGVRYGPSESPTDTPIPNETLFERIRGAGFGPEVQRRILLGTYSLSSAAADNYFVQAQKVRRLVQQDFDSVFAMPNVLHDRLPTSNLREIDYIVCPTTPTPAPTLEQVEAFTQLEAYTNDVFTVPASLAGIPAISVPVLPPPSSGQEWNAGTGIGIPGMGIGIQVIGQFGDDAGVLAFAGKEIEPAWEELKKLRSMNRHRFL